MTEAQKSTGDHSDTESDNAQQLDIIDVGSPCDNVTLAVLAKSNKRKCTSSDDELELVTTKKTAVQQEPTDSSMEASTGSDSDDDDTAYTTVTHQKQRGSNAIVTPVQNKTNYYTHTSKATQSTSPKRRLVGHTTSREKLAPSADNSAASKHEGMSCASTAHRTVSETD